MMKTKKVLQQVSRETRGQLFIALYNVINELQGDETMEEMFLKKYDGMSTLWDLYAMSAAQELNDAREELKPK